LGTSIATVDINTDLVENIGNYNKLNGCINKNFEKSMRQNVKETLQNLVSKAALKYANETWVLRSRDKERFEAAQMTFMRSLFGVTERESERDTEKCRHDVRIRGTNIVVETEHYRKKWKEHTLRTPPPRYPVQALVFIPTVVRDFGPTTQKVERSILASEHVFQAYSLFGKKKLSEYSVIGDLPQWSVIVYLHWDDCIYSVQVSEKAAFPQETKKIKKNSVEVRRSQNLSDV
jgi:hypothetical protein